MASRSILICIFLFSAVSLIYGLSLEDGRGKRELDEPTEEDCMRPPMRGRGNECCRLPKERIWGDLRSSIHKCLKKYKPGHKPMNQEVTEDLDEQAVTPVNGADESAGTSSQPFDSPDGYRGQHGRPMKKTLSERIKELFTSMYKVVKNTFDALWQTVIMITDRLPRHQNDSCFMECVFEDQGFLMNKLVNKFALIGKLDKTLEKNEQWHKVAVQAVETCSQVELKNDNTTCQSGSEEIFRCIFKHLFFNCPSWSQTKYCTSLKKFYEKCPNGPPPVMNDSHPTSIPEEMETVTTTESEKYFE